MPEYNVIMQRPDPVLSSIVIGHENQDAVNEGLARVINVDDRKGQFPKWGLDAFRLESDTRRAPRTKANAVDFGYSFQPFDMEEHALDFEYEEKEKQEYDKIGGGALFNMERDGVKSTEDRLQLRREKRAGDRLRANDVPGEVLASAVRWDQAATDIPLAGRKARAEIRRRTGKIMNTVLLPFEVDDIVMWHPTVKEYLGTSNEQFVSVELLKRVFRVDNIITASMIYNTGTDLAPNFLDVWGKDVIFAYVNNNPNPSAREMSLAYNFRYAKTNNEAATPAAVNTGNGYAGMPVTAWYDQNTETHIRRVKYEEKIHVVSPGCGYVFREAIS